MKVKGTDSWVLDALGWSFGRAVGIAAVCVALVIYEVVYYPKSPSMPDAEIIKLLKALGVFMAAMVVVDVVTVLLRDTPLAFGMTAVGFGTVLALAAASMYGATPLALGIALVGSVPQFFLGPVRALVFQRTMPLSGTPSATDESWLVAAISGTRVLNKADFVDADVKRPDAWRWRWFYMYSMDFIHADNLSAFTFDRRNKNIVTVFVVWVELDYNGTFRVTWEPKLRYLCPDRKKPLTVERVLGVKSTELKQTIVECSGDDVKAFFVADASTVELAKPDMENYRQGRLLFLEHDLIRVDLRGRNPITIARDFRWGRGDAEEKVGYLRREFEPPSDGWKPALAPAREAHRIEQTAKKNRDNAATYWNGPALVPIIVQGRKFAAPIDAAFYDDALSLMRENKHPQMWRTAADKVAAALEAPATVWRDGDTPTTCYAAAFLPFVLSCKGAGEAFDVRTHANVMFYPPSFNMIYHHAGDTVRVDVVTETAHRNFIVQLSKVADFKIARAGDLKLPDTFLLRGDVIKSDDALVPYIECTDGVIVPLAYTTKMRRDVLERWVGVLKEAQATCHQPVAKKAASQTAGRAPASEDFDPI